MLSWLCRLNCSPYIPQLKLWIEINNICILPSSHNWPFGLMWLTQSVFKYEHIEAILIPSLSTNATRSSVYVYECWLELLLVKRAKWCKYTLIFSWQKGKICSYTYMYNYAMRVQVHNYCIYGMRLRISCTWYSSVV